MPLLVLCHTDMVRVRGMAEVSRCVCVCTTKARFLDLVWQAKERCPSSSGPAAGACIAHHQPVSVAGASVCFLGAAGWTEQPAGQEKSRLHGAGSSRSGCAGPSEES